MIELDYITSCCAGLGVFSLFVLFFALIIFLATRGRRKFRKTLENLASNLGCSYRKGGWLSSPHVEGEYKGRRILVDTFTQDSGEDNSTTYTRVRVWHKGSLSGDISVYREGLLSKVGKVLGVQDIQLGNPTFDQEFVVKGKNVLEVKSLLDVEAQHRLLELKIPLTIRPDVVYFDQTGYVNDKERLLGVINLMVWLAEKAEGR